MSEVPKPWCKILEVGMHREKNLKFVICKPICCNDANRISNFVYPSTKNAMDFFFCLTQYIIIPFTLFLIYKTTYMTIMTRILEK